jgi:hypothetical protein
MPTNMADVAKRLGSARQAAAERDTRGRATITLTPIEVRAIQHTISKEKASAVIGALKEAGLVAAAKAAKRGADRGAVSPLEGQTI